MITIDFARRTMRVASILIKIFVNLIPKSQLEIFEMRIQQTMGKGWGAQSIKTEPTCAVQLLRKYFPKIKEPVLFDVGANIGKWTEGALSESDVKVICFEPSQSAFEILVKKFALNDRVSVVNIALGGSNRIANLYSDTPGSSLSSLSKRNLNHLDIEFNTMEIVEVKTLDNWVKDHKILPDILKLDVEGFEFEVLSGSTETISEIKVIQLEFGGCNIDTRTFFADYWDLLKNLEFTFFRLTPRGLIHVSRYSESLETFTTTNYYAVNSRKL